MGRLVGMDWKVAYFLKEANQFCATVTDVPRCSSPVISSTIRRRFPSGDTS